MKSTLICALLLTFLYGSVFAGISFEGKIESKNEDAKIFPKPGKPPASKTSFSGRIIRGKDASIETYPYIVHLRVDLVGSRKLCGASVITYSHAFTAAHCVYNADPASITLYGGSTSRSSGGIEFYVEKAVVHPTYNPKTLDNDAAIVQVIDTFQGYKNIVPIALQTDEVPAGTSCYAAGWGLNNYEARTSPDNLQYALLKAQSSEACLDAWPDRYSIICAHQGNGVNVCKGDSGGPLVCNGKLTGAASFVSRGCQDDFPAGFAKVMAPAIREFIRTNAGI